MSRALVLPINCIFKFNGNRISDHNRSPLMIDPERIENKKRMANGTLRTFIVATKRNFKVSWNQLPRDDNKTVDHFWGASSLYNFYKTHLDEITLTITYGDNSTENVVVLWDSFSIKLNKRSLYTDFYDIDITLKEV